MKKVILFLLATVCLSACHESLEQRAAREAKEYTKKNCPSAIKHNIRTDSLTFDENTRTMIYYYSMFNQLDDSAKIARDKDKLLSVLSEALKTDISIKTYKEAGFNFRYEYHSATRPNLILLEKTFTPEDYAQ